MPWDNKKNENYWESDDNDPNRGNLSLSSLLYYYVEVSGNDYILSKNAFDKFVFTMLRKGKLDFGRLLRVKDYSKRK